MAGAPHTKTSLKVVPLNRETLQDRVYRRVCDLILDGEIAPGQLVTIQSLADACEVSHMPVREALKRLTAAKALTVVSGRSIGIPRLNRASLNDLRNVRREIEGLAATWATRNITDAELLGIEDVYRKLGLANAKGDVRSFLRANHAFHFAIYRAARSERLITIIEDLWLQISPYFNLLRGSGNYEVSNTHHQVMVDGLKARNEKQVADAVRADIEDAYQVLLGLVSP
ncbi:GntR family transcriptional regulator [Taklimakanibacter deserti]|uniref:GntR family transcriptional regulator n=1 Tax=Taklimakanibacter deserti TaxID=2267839 RepID=UPI000E65DCCC